MRKTKTKKRYSRFCTKLALDFSVFAGYNRSNKPSRTGENQMPNYITWTVQIHRHDNLNDKGHHYTLHFNTHIQQDGHKSSEYNRVIRTPNEDQIEKCIAWVDDQKTTWRKTYMSGDSVIVTGHRSNNATSKVIFHVPGERV